MIRQIDTSKTRHNSKIFSWGKSHSSRPYATKKIPPLLYNIGINNYRIWMINTKYGYTFSFVIFFNWAPLKTGWLRGTWQKIIENPRSLHQIWPVLISRLLLSMGQKGGNSQAFQLEILHRPNLAISTIADTPVDELNGGPGHHLYLNLSWLSRLLTTFMLHSFARVNFTILGKR